MKNNYNSSTTLTTSHIRISGSDNKYSYLWTFEFICGK